MISEEFHKFELSTLYPYYKYEPNNEEIGALNNLIKKVSIGSYVEALKEEECQKVLRLNLVHSNTELDKECLTDLYRKQFSEYLKSEGLKGEQVLYCIGISCLQIFTQNNFTGPFVGPHSFELIPCLKSINSNGKNSELNAFSELVLDTESIYPLVTYPEYLVIARVIFFYLRNQLSSCIGVSWWCCRYGIVHQKVGEEQSPSFYEMLLECLHSIENEPKLLNEESNRDITALFHLEAAQIHLQYYDVGKAKHHVDKALLILAMDISLTGALGVRTKWQQHQLAQLVVKVAYSGNPITQEELVYPTLLPSDTPKDVILNDDTRHHQIKFQEVDESIIPNLRPLEQMALFAHFIVKRKSQAQDEMLIEESKTYLMAILQYPKNWVLQLGALALRSRIESGEMRAMERSLNQFEELVNAITGEEPSRFERLKLAHCCPLLTQWNLQQELARMFMRLGCIKTALEIFEKLHLWEDMIVCYNDLQMRQRSAEVIRELLDKEETPKLWCLMGDATDDIQCYYKAWELSNHKSGRVQRCLGNYYYTRKEFTKAMEHFEKSVQINSIQFPVWQRLAYCALQAENWQKCATAYKRCSVLEPDSFECWNNMSQAYLKMGETYKAWKSLQEALRCKMDNWRLWDNYMLVSTSLGYMTQAINAYNRILLYKEKHIDTEILGKIVQAIIYSKSDPDGKPMNTLRKNCLDLVGKLTREVPSNAELWFFNAELIFTSPERSQEMKHTAMQHYRKAVASDTQKSGWETNTASVGLVLMRALKLIEVAKVVCECSDPKGALADLSSMRMLIRNLIFSVKKSQIDNETGKIVESIETPLNQVEEGLDDFNNLIQKFSSS